MAEDVFELDHRERADKVWDGHISAQATTKSVKEYAAAIRKEGGIKKGSAAPKDDFKKFLSSRK